MFQSGLFRADGVRPSGATWWIEPLVVFLVLASFLVYATWAAFQNAHYDFGPYLSPFYAPELGRFAARVVRSQACLVAGAPAVLAGAADPAVPGLFRFTCYYYRGAYYKAFWADPPSAPSANRAKSYLGENLFPLILQNIHRYFATSR